MMTPQQKRTLEYAVTRYDRRRTSRPSYNHYALAQYLRAVDLTEDAMKSGADLRSALEGNFNGHLLSALLKSLGLQLN